MRVGVLRALSILADQGFRSETSEPKPSFTHAPKAFVGPLILNADDRYRNSCMP